MTTLLFHAVPLTPIHIGDGSQLRPEDFLIDRGELLRFSPARVVAEMPSASRQAFVDAVAAGRLKEAQALIRASVDRAAHVFERIGVGSEAEAYLSNAVDNPAQSGEAMPFVRTAGRPYIPGSSLKGALRTALTSDRANAARRSAVAQAIERDLETLQRELPKTPRTGQISDAMQRSALDYDRGATEGDPLRDLSVADAPLGSGSTRFDKVTVGWTPRQRDDARRGRQLHVERVLSVIDRCSPADVAFTLVLTVADPHRQEQRRRLADRKTPRSPVLSQPLLEAAHNFHLARWQDELDRLFPAGSPVRRRLEDARKKAEAYAQTLAASTPLTGFAPCLVRVGRFTGFESKSADTWRRGWAPQTKKILSRAGTHSMLVDGADALPFGWMLLCAATEAATERVATFQPAEAPPAPAAGTATAASPPRPTAPRRASVGGEAVEIVSRKGGEVCVRFVVSGDTEWIDASELDPE